MAHSSNSSFFSLEEISKPKSSFGMGGLVRATPQIHNELDNTELNIAVTGKAGSGKSTFINAMRGLQSGDEGAAQTGTTETTMEPTRYKHPNLPNVCFWDLPGIGTTRFPAKNYLKKMQFNKYDFFLIISDCRFTENDVKLAKECKRLEKNFYFIRSKVDNDLYPKRKEGRKLNEEKELKKIRNYCERNLQEAGIQSPRVFLISNFDLNLYDFNLLNKALEVDLPNIKRSIYILALPNINLEIIERKREELRNEIWIMAALSGAMGAVPVAGLSLACDIGIVSGGIIYFRKCLGLDDASLQRLADTVEIPLEDLKAMVKTPLVGEITPDIIMRLRWGLASATISAVELVFNNIPIIGSIFGAGSSYLMTYKLLSCALDDLTENAKRVMNVAFGTDLNDQSRVVYELM
ncbi:interferon-inducible GTPase 5-like [Scyliorhinus canicula]|uniref:interferon-inducible GTPase 5-like n=1 Tax=Scyliorhinus canicula TaxID=7830 RepID=UPI0018F2C7CD|nr:interferon-inducible GTPase 5-like [Scyliorhinus canicula]